MPRPAILAALPCACLLLSLAACATGPRERVVRARFDCDDGRKLTVLFNQTRDVAVVPLSRKERVELPSAHPASGMWYRADGYELRGAGDTLSYREPGRAPATCVQTR